MIYWFSILDEKEKSSNKQKRIKNTSNKCFQYTITVALNCEEIKSHQERVSNNKPFLNKYSYNPGQNRWDKL